MDLLALLGVRRAPPATIPDGRVRYAIGDIHGCADLLEEMFARLEARAGDELRPAGEPVVIFLGDYIDRGRESARVLDLLLQGRPAGYERRYLKGNHEQGMLAFLEAPVENRAWIMHGGAETLLSYNVKPPSPLQSTEADWIAAAALLKQNMPEAHLRFLRNLERYIAVGDYVFAHAGVDPSRALTEQTDQDLFWIRAKFLKSRNSFGRRRVVHGHTPVERPYADRRRVGVDTGAYASGVLTAARIEGKGLEFVAVTDREARAARARAAQDVQF